MHATQPARLAAQYYYIAGTLSVAELRLSEQATVAVFALNCPKTIRPVLSSKFRRNLNQTINSYLFLSFDVHLYIESFFNTLEHKIANSISK